MTVAQEGHPVVRMTQWLMHHACGPLRPWRSAAASSACAAVLRRSFNAARPAPRVLLAWQLGHNAIMKPGWSRPPWAIATMLWLTDRRLLAPPADAVATGCGSRAPGPALLEKRQNGAPRQLACLREDRNACLLERLLPREHRLCWGDGHLGRLDG